MKNKLVDDVADYYSRRLAEHGATAKGVDWNGEESQQIRFEQMLKILPTSKEQEFTVADIGCGYGAFAQFLTKSYPQAIYRGYDVSEEMVSEASRQLSNMENANAFHGRMLTEKSDFCVASGIFSVKLESKNTDWLEYIYETLDHLNTMSLEGFAFNCLTSYSEAHLMKGKLYYADPLLLFDYCKRKFSRNVALLHDYELYEFTILVRK